MTWKALTLMLFFSVVIAEAHTAYAVEEKPKDDSFVVSTVNAIFDKVNQYSSGEKGILIEDYDKPEEKGGDYTTDALGRKLAEPTIRTAPVKAPASAGDSGAAAGQ